MIAASDKANSIDAQGFRSSNPLAPASPLKMATPKSRVSWRDSANKGVISVCLYRDTEYILVRHEPLAVRAQDFVLNDFAGGVALKYPASAAIGFDV